MEEITVYQFAIDNVRKHIRDGVPYDEFHINLFKAVDVLSVAFMKCRGEITKDLLIDLFDKGENNG